MPIIVRLREGVSPERFREKCEHEWQQSLTTEHCYIRKIESVSEKAGFDHGRLDGALMHRNLLIAAFFATNLAFGVFGTLLMYMRQRREEAGVRRAFGATKWSVFWGFIREAWVLTTVSVFIGCIIYFQYQISGDFYEKGVYDNPAVHHWFDSIETHFPIVSLCVYIIILCTVLLGTVIPAWRICRSEITESLREE
jgi:ABC-type lipoprotein release transport system permease subunit